MTINSDVRHIALRENFQQIVALNKLKIFSVCFGNEWFYKDCLDLLPNDIRDLKFNLRNVSPANLTKALDCIQRCGNHLRNLTLIQVTLNNTFLECIANSCPAITEINIFYRYSDHNLYGVMKLFQGCSNVSIVKICDSDSDKDSRFINATNSTSSIYKHVALILNDAFHKQKSRSVIYFLMNISVQLTRLILHKVFLDACLSELATQQTHIESLILEHVMVRKLTLYTDLRRFGELSSNTLKELRLGISSCVLNDCEFYDLFVTNCPFASLELLVIISNPFVTKHTLELMLQNGENTHPKLREVLVYNCPNAGEPRVVNINTTSAKLVVVAAKVSLIQIKNGFFFGRR